MENVVRVGRLLTSAIGGFFVVCFGGMDQLMISSNEGRVNNAGVITISPKTIKQDEIQIKVSKNTPTSSIFNFELISRLLKIRWYESP